jgi:hypothetical protein
MPYFNISSLFGVLPYSNSLISEVFLGDGHTLHTSNSACNHCIGLQPKPHFPKTTLLPMSNAHVPTPASTSFPQGSDSIALPAVPASVFPSVDYVTGTSEPSPEPIRVRRAETTFAPDPAPSLVLPHVPVSSMPPSSLPVPRLDIVGSQLPVYDGQLDTSSNYTGFVEVIGETAVF